MKELKFRAWDYHFGRWNYASLLPNGEWEVTERSVLNDKLVEDKKIGDWLQFTGLLDKSGAEIWEGDIVKIHNLGSVVEVKWFSDDEIVGFNLSTDFEYEVIGNTYNNTELLK